MSSPRFSVPVILILGVLLLAMAAVLYLYGGEPRSRKTEGDNSLARVKASGRLRIAINLGTYPWAAYDSETGRESGAEAEIAKLAAADMSLTADFTDDAEPLKAVREGRADVAFYRLYEDVTAEDLIYTRGYFANGLALIVRADSQVKNLEQVSSKKIGIAADACCVHGVKAASDRGALTAHYQGTDASTRVFRDIETGVLEGGLVEMTEAAWYVRSHPLLKITGGDKDGFSVPGASFRAALRREDITLKESLDRTIGKISGSREFRDILSRWYLFKEG